MFIFKLWRGEYSLFKTYWLFNILLGTILGSPLSIIGQLPSETIKSTWVYWLIYLILYSLYIIISSVGVWRSASKYSKDSLWKNLAKFYSFVSVASIVAIIIFYGTLIIKGGKSNEMTYSLYGCKNSSTSQDPNCNLDDYKGIVKFDVNKEKSEVILLLVKPESHQSNIFKLEKCVVIDRLNWKCGKPVDTEVSKWGIAIIQHFNTYTSVDGNVNISDAGLTTIDLNKNNKIVSQTIFKGGVLKKN
jgi:hypothetical protein